MNEHLTEWDMQHYAQIHTMTPDNLAFVAQVNSHVFQCEKCKLMLDWYCEQEMQKAPVQEAFER